MGRICEADYHRRLFYMQVCVLIRLEAVRQFISKTSVPNRCCVFYHRAYDSNVQEGQHPLTGQRAANFRLLANQRAERRLVTQ